MSGIAYGIQVRVFLDSVGAVAPAPPDRTYSLALDGESWSASGALTGLRGSCGIVGLDATQSMSGHSATLEILVGDVGAALRTLVECQDTLRIEINNGRGWEVAFDGFVSQIAFSETSTVQGFSWRMSLSGEGIHKLWNQLWMNWASVIKAGQASWYTAAGMSLYSEITSDHGFHLPSVTVHRLLDFGVSNLMKLSVRGAGIGMAKSGQPGFWQTGAEVDPRFWSDAFGLSTTSEVANRLMQNGPLWGIIQGLIEPDLQELFVTYLPSIADLTTQIPTVVFRPHPFPGAKGDDAGWAGIADDALLMGAENDAPGPLSISATKNDSRRANAYIWSMSSANDSDQPSMFSKTAVGYWIDMDSVKRYGFGAKQFHTSLCARGPTDWWTTIIPKALERVAFQSHPLPCLWTHRRTYPLTPHARVGTPLWDSTDGCCGYIVQVAHRVSSTPTGFKGGTTVSVDRVVEGLGALADYPEAVRRFTQGLVKDQFLADSGVQAAQGVDRAPLSPSHDVRVPPCPLPVKGSPIGAARKCGAFHQGVDFPMAIGVVLRSPCNGTFQKSEYQNAGGNVVRFVGVDGSVHAFAHLDSVASLPPGELLKAGVTILGTSGTSGNASTGPHLHWQIFGKDRQPVDPTIWLQGGAS